MALKFLLAMITVLTSATSTFGGHLKIKIFNSGKNAISPVTSTIVYGQKDAILIDAQFLRQYAIRLIEEIKATGKNLIAVYISQSDPDYYFGVNEIKEAFSNAKIVSKGQTAYLISVSKDEKLTVWKEQLKSDAPSDIIVPQAVSILLHIEGSKIGIITTNNDLGHSFLWTPSKNYFRWYFSNY